MAIHRRQLTIIHLTDIHFGKDHRFDPARAPDGSLASRVGVPKLYQSILKDLASRKPEERAYFTGAATAGAGTPRCPNNLRTNRRFHPNR